MKRLYVSMTLIICFTNQRGTALSVKSFTHIVILHHLLDEVDTVWKRNLHTTLGVILHKNDMSIRRAHTVLTLLNALSDHRKLARNQIDILNDKNHYLYF